MEDSIENAVAPEVVQVPEVAQVPEVETVKVFDVADVTSVHELANLSSEEVDALSLESIAAIKAKFGPEGIRAIMPQSRKKFIRTETNPDTNGSVKLGEQSTQAPIVNQ